MYTVEDRQEDRHEEMNELKSPPAHHGVQGRRKGTELTLTDNPENSRLNFILRLLDRAAPPHGLPSLSYALISSLIVIVFVKYALTFDVSAAFAFTPWRRRASPHRPLSTPLSLLTATIASTPGLTSFLPVMQC
jgi:hypothetical protein